MAFESLPRRSPYRGELRLTADHPSISKFRRSLLKAGSQVIRGLADSENGTNRPKVHARVLPKPPNLISCPHPTCFVPSS
jgi:hypothetical protein